MCGIEKKALMYISIQYQKVLFLHFNVCMLYSFIKNAAIKQKNILLAILELKFSSFLKNACFEIMFCK